MCSYVKLYSSTGSVRNDRICVRMSSDIAVRAL